MRTKNVQSYFSFLIVVLAFSLGCSAEVPTGITIDCYSETCPDPITLAVSLEAFRDNVFSDFSSLEDLTIEWHGADEVLEEIEPGERYWRKGATFGPDFTQVTSHWSLMHELVHVHFWRLYGDGDGDHADGAGPWTELTDKAVERATDAQRMARCGTLDEGPEAAAACPL